MERIAFYEHINIICLLMLELDFPSHANHVFLWQMHKIYKKNINESFRCVRKYKLDKKMFVYGILVKKFSLLNFIHFANIEFPTKKDLENKCFCLEMKYCVYLQR